MPVAMCCIPAKGKDDDMNMPEKPNKFVVTVNTAAKATCFGANADGDIRIMLVRKDANGIVSRTDWISVPKGDNGRHNDGSKTTICKLCRFYAFSFFHLGNAVS
ncbi:hypothetical protein L596_016499 [Steinernema carpocapsae]|uniref:Uncharacterized protein n=1 Tax=Steinernema carpocapsae TaxID=34508 RepID=A0A4U5NJ71_STECR|nr:hypothetical protein L596_016499 [Steinernema carpocapsae]